MKLFPTKIFTSVPDEIKGQYEQLQLKNSLRRLKYLAIVLSCFRLITLVLYFLTDGNIVDSNRLTQLLYSASQIYLPSSLIQMAVNILFIVLVGNVFQKSTRFNWAMCYSLVLFNFGSMAMIISRAEHDIQILFIFFITLVFNVLVPNFKPKIFLIFAGLFFIASINAMVYNPAFSRGADILLFDFATFFTILIIKVLHYNSNTRVFIEMKEIESLNEKLEALSITDELTRINNRRSFLDYMDITWKQSRRLKLPLSVMMVDIDFFKKYNDSMGHLEGDNVLIAVAQCMKNQLKRDTDFVARFGGEEFVILLPYVEKEAAASFAEELVKSVENMKIPHPMNDNSKYITISAGMANIVPDENTSSAQLLDEADKALYVAKETGRNKVVIN